MRIFFEAFGEDVGQILTIIGQQGDSLLYAKAIKFDDDHYEELEQRFCCFRISSRIDFANVNLN